MSNAFGVDSGSLVRRGIDGARQIIDQLQRPDGRNVPRRDRSEGVRPAVLTVLAEQPMHGYQVIRAIEQRGLPAQTAGAVYPTLQLLADEGLATAADSDGRRVYSLTQSGRAAAAATSNRAAPAELIESGAPARIGTIPRAGARLAGVAAEVARTGSAQQVADAAAVLDEARRKLHSILAR